MHVVIVYESMYGNTHAVANCVAEGLRHEACDVTVVPVGKATKELTGHCDLLVVGAPTHVHGLPRPATRKSATQAADKPGSGLILESGALGPGLREWLHDLPAGDGYSAVAFDTRMNGPCCSRGKLATLSRTSCAAATSEVVTPVHSFVVSKENVLEAGEAERARTRGKALAFAAGPFLHAQSTPELHPPEADM